MRGDEVSFQARYNGRCADCEERIHEGDHVEYRSDELCHVTCPTPTDPYTVKPGEALCGQCFTYHRGECL